MCSKKCEFGFQRRYKVAPCMPNLAPVTLSRIGHGCTISLSLHHTLPYHITPVKCVLYICTYTVPVVGHNLPTKVLAKVNFLLRVHENQLDLLFVYIYSKNKIGYLILYFKGIVSRDFEWLQMILMDRLCP